MMHAWCVFALLLQQPTPPEEGPEKKVVITASPLNPKDIFDTPYSADVVTSERIRFSRSTPEALREVPGVSLQKTAHGHGSPFIRGFTGFRNVFLIDGIRLNSSIFREGPNQYWNTVDPFIIERLDIVRGPSSVLYGSDSIGGTVVAYTREPREGERGPHGRLSYRFAGAERSNIARAETWGSQDSLGWLAGVSVKDFNDIEGAGRTGRMPKTGYDEYDVDAKFVVRLDEARKLVIAAERARQDDVPRTHATVFSRPWHGTTVGSDLERRFRQERDLVTVQLHQQSRGGFVDALDASLSWQRVAETLRRRTGGDAREFRALELDTPGLWARAGKDTPAGYLTFGLEFYRDWVTSEGHNASAAGVVTSFARGEIAGDAIYDLFGMYVQDELSIGALDITPGLRFTWAAVDADEVDPDPADAIVFDDVDDDYRAVTGSVRFVHHVTEEWNLIAGWGMGFRTPSLDDTTAIKLVMSGSLDLPAEGLDPEKSHTFDLGVRARYPKWEANVFGFTTLLRDFIQRVPAGDFNGDGITDFTKDNFSDGRVTGFELSGLYRVTEEVSLFADWAYVKGEAEALIGGATTEQPLSKINPSTAHLGVRYEPKGTGVWIEGLATLVRHQHHLSPTDATDTQRIPPGGTPGFGVLGVRGGYRVSERLLISAAVENLTDKDYRLHGSGQNEPGTNFIASIDVSF
ncbi:MAG: TonB-dependent receptor [Planctomycetes bacterium]|nr:TonB-dependent receptor [Planctomycetota bacterium]